MAYKMAALEAPPSTNRPAAVQKHVTPAAAVREEAAKAEEYGYIVTNQRYGTLTSSNQDADEWMSVCLHVCWCERRETSSSPSKYCSTSTSTAFVMLMLKSSEVIKHKCIHEI